MASEKMTRTAALVRSRIVGHEEVAPDQLLANPLNFRRHPGPQLDALRGSMKDLGWVKEVIVNRTTGYVVDGHARVEEALRQGLPTVPVTYVDLSPEEERLALAVLDPITEMAFRDDDALAALLAEVRTEDPGLRAMLREMAEGTAGRPGTSSGVLVEKFGIAPFSVLNAREGWWQERKKAWLDLGIRSEVGRGENAIGRSPQELVAFNLGVHYDEARRIVEEAKARGLSDEDIVREHRRHKGRAFYEDLMGGAVFKGKDNPALLLRSKSGRVPDYYAQKRGAEARLGRTLTTEEFERDYLVVSSASGLSSSGTSVFDPVLCELLYRWFCPKGGVVLDPFAGGSVRGVVASALGRGYYGIDLSAVQVAANEEQHRVISAGGCSPATPRTPSPVPDAYVGSATPVEEHGGYLVKRDDLFAVAGVRGGKARSCWALAAPAAALGAAGVGLVTAGSRQSPQVNIVAHIAARLGVPCRVHVPSGGLTPELRSAVASGAEVVQHNPGYNNVIVARAREDAAERGWLLVPFGMECTTAVEETAAQVSNLPLDAVRRIVIPVGSGMSLAGVLHGLARIGSRVPVLGVRVGADPTERLDAYAPPDWRERVTLVESSLDYHDHAPAHVLGDLVLDPVYEGKCLPFLQPGDLLWVVGIRETAAAAEPEAGIILPPGAWSLSPAWVCGDSLDAPLPAEPVDFVFSCPPYVDLERYSDDPRDLSTMSYPDFLQKYRAIIARACAALRPDRFAAFVVGEVRDDDGAYLNFVGATTQAFVDAGLRFYNEAILVTAAGSLAIRTGRAFEGSRKLGKTHQNVLIFVKGDPKVATAAIGDCEFSLPPPEEDDPT